MPVAHPAAVDTPVHSDAARVRDTHIETLLLCRDVFDLRYSAAYSCVWINDPAKRTFRTRCWY